MAKMTIGPVTYEGTPEELQAIVMTFPTDDAEASTEVKPKYKTEKRRAKVGERILITDASPVSDQKYSDGDVLTVIRESACDYDDVAVEGQPSFIDYIEYEVIVEPTQAKPKPADKLSHKGADYSLIQRKAQAGDVVVFTENTSNCVENGAPYGPVARSRQSGEMLHEDSGFRVYSGNFNRTEANVLVYEKVAEAKPKFNDGDIVMTHDLNNGHSGVIGEVVGADNARPLVKARNKRGEERTLYSHSTLICTAESRVDTK